MGDIIGGVIGGVGSLFGSHDQEKADKAGAKAALTGYNYLTSGAGAAPENSYINTGASANDAEAQLLGLTPITSQTQNGFNNYLNSTGYNFMLNQGTNAITGNAASRGIVNSGATAKALTQFGQNLATQNFNNYLGQVGTLAQRGQTGLGQVASAGAAGGAAASQALQASGNAQSTGLNNALGSFTNAIGSII